MVGLSLPQKRLRGFSLVFGDSTDREIYRRDARHDFVREYVAETLISLRLFCNIGVDLVQSCLTALPVARNGVGKAKPLCEQF